VCLLKGVMGEFAGDGGCVAAEIGDVRVRGGCRVAHAQPRPHATITTIITICVRATAPGAGCLSNLENFFTWTKEI
jgi:hypothetical protein